MSHLLQSLLRILVFSNLVQWTCANQNKIVVVGSVNADIIVPIEQFPSKGETVVARNTIECGKTLPGGKGANQAVACQRLGVPTTFICQFGNDANAEMLKTSLVQNNVDISFCRTCDSPSGTGLVFLQESGEVSAIVLGGSNAAWPEKVDLSHLFARSTGIACVLLQMEIPQHINEQVAEAAYAAGIDVFQDCGGTECAFSASHLQKCTYISPNLTELIRMTKMPATNYDEIVAAAKSLQSFGAKNVLVTLGSEGALLLTESGEIIRQDSIPTETVVDETGAGDNYRAAFVVSRYVDKKTVEDSLEYAAAAGALSVTKMGAMPSCSTREECDAYLERYHEDKKRIQNLRGGCILSTSVGERTTNVEQVHKDEGRRTGFPSPYKFASRLNSMKDRADLWNGPSGMLGWIARQGKIKGLDLVDFNYPQHITSPKVTTEAKEEIITALDQAGLKCGAICLRFPKEMQLGAYTHPNRDIRNKAIQLTKEACDWAQALGAHEVVVWSAFDGYDYSLQVDYGDLWDHMLAAFQEVCDAYPTVKVSLEYKPTDENTRFFAVPSAGAAVLLVEQVNRDNFGLTIDFGHCLMAGENPAQSVALVSRCRHRNRNKSTLRHSNALFGVQLGDGYGRLGAEDGLAFGSIHSLAALEFVLWLIKTNYSGHIYFDTFPRNEDPVRECEYNIRQFKRMYALAQSMLSGSHKELFESLQRDHDAMGMLELLESFESSAEN